jgi:hypothetical protein
MSVETIEASAPPSTITQRVRWAIEDGLVLTRRNLLRYLPDPDPVGLLDDPAGDVRPAVSVRVRRVDPRASAGIGLAEDLNAGIIDRVRSLPMSRSAVLAGRTTADLFRNLFVVLLMTIVGYLVGSGSKRA